MDVYVQVSAAPFSTQNTLPPPPPPPPGIRRRSANYHPSVWGDHFLKYDSHITKIDGDTDQQQFEQLKEQVRKMLVAVGGSDEPAGSGREQLKLIDAIQRLGVSYHFQSEINVALNNHLHGSFGDQRDNNINDDDDEQLYMVALRFRLLRQQGYYVSNDVFNKFKDDEGKFKESLIKDTRGLLSLYEAAHLRVHDEDILDEALEFTTTHLEQVLNSLRNPILASQVVHALNQPIRKALTRLHARHYIPIYQQHHSHNETTLLKFAKLDFNMLQKVHQRELSDITRWWKDLNFKEKLPFARDRLVECYFWILGVYFEPQYFLTRKFLTQVISMASVLDDIYDLYGTLEELILFTDAIDRWDISGLDQLPEYMGICYQALLDVYAEMEEKLSKDGRSYHVHYAKEALKELVKAYFEEAKWYNEGYVPTLEEYLQNGLVSSGYKMLAITSFVGMGELLVTKQAFDWVSNNPLIVRASSVIARLTDDMGGHEKIDGDTDQQQFEQLKEQVRKMLVAVGGSDEPVGSGGEQLKLIDAIQRLGVSYHFQSEINVALNNHLHGSFGDQRDNNINDDDDEQLYMVALRFRLLRQQGYYVSNGKLIICHINKAKG